MNANSKKTFCRICEAACGLVATRDENGNVIQLRPDKAHPVSKGYMCAKGVRFADVANHPERILRPQLRGENGRFHPISWSQAIDTIVQKIKPIQQQYGNHAVGVYYGNPLLFNTLGLISLLAFNKALGTRNVYSSFSQDCNNKFAAAHLMYGGEMIQPIPDLANADFALMFGTNPAISQGSFVHFDRGATAFDTFIDKGGDVLWVDPRRSESAKRWGSHLPIRPGTDIYLLLTLLHELRDLYRPDTAVTGMDALLELAAGYPVEKTAVFTHIPIDQIQTLATKLRQSNQTAFHMSVGVNMGPFGTLSYIAMQALAHLTGNLDAVGGNLFHPLGKPFSKLLHLANIGTNPEPSRIGQLMGVFDELPGGILADEILTPGDDQIRAMIVIGGNPVHSIPGEAKLKQAFANLEFMVQIDLFENETAVYADLMLPATSWLERFDVATTGSVLQTSPLVHYGGAVQPPPGETRHERQILAELSVALAQPIFNRRWLARWWGKAKFDRTLPAILNGLLWPYRVFKRGVHGIPVPVPRNGRLRRSGTMHPDKKIHFWHPSLAKEAERLTQFSEAQHANTSPNQFMLIGRRRRIGHNSWLHQAQHTSKKAEVAWMNKLDLEGIGIPEGGLIRVDADNNHLLLNVKSDASVTRGILVMPHGIPDVNINALIRSGTEQIEPLSGNHIMTGIPVRVQVAKTAVSTHLQTTLPQASAD